MKKSFLGCLSITALACAFSLSAEATGKPNHQPPPSSQRGSDSTNTSVGANIGQNNLSAKSEGGLQASAATSGHGDANGHLVTWKKIEIGEYGPWKRWKSDNPAELFPENLRYNDCGISMEKGGPDLVLTAVEPMEGGNWLRQVVYISFLSDGTSPSVDEFFRKSASKDDHLGHVTKAPEGTDLFRKACLSETGVLPENVLKSLRVKYPDLSARK